MVVFCAMYGCLSSSKHDKERRFFHFPRDTFRCKEWVKATGRPELMSKTVEVLNKYYVICDLHFHENDRLVKYLRTNAIPTLFLPNVPEVYSYHMKTTQTDLTLLGLESSSQTINFTTIISENPCTTNITQNLSSKSQRKRKLKKNKMECAKKICLEDDLSLTSSNFTNTNISPQLQKIIDAQNQLQQYCHGKKYDYEYKLFALSLYFASPLAYRVLGKILNLPNKRTLLRANIKTGTKFGPHVLTCLESKIKVMKESEKFCTICVGEMSLKTFLCYLIRRDKMIGFHEIDGMPLTEPASKAFVVMARGIFSNWKQPLAYSFLADSRNYKELNTWLDNIISSLLKIGFHVVAFVSDHRSFHFNLAEERNVSVEKPYFFIDNRKIFYIFDVPQLMKSLRNNFIKHNFEFHDVYGSKLVATWEVIEALYRDDSKRQYRLAPKLTQSHINPNKFEKDKVKFAAQLFSKSVAVALNCSIELGNIEDNSLGTVKFIKLMNDTFDILNSATVSDSYVYKNAFSAKPYQIETLNNFLDFLSDVVVRNKRTNKDVKNSMKSFEGLKISVNSIMQLSEDLRSNFRILFTRRLNLNPLQMFFRSVRKQGGNRRKPTPVKFIRTFKKLFMENLLKHSKNENCSNDLDLLLLNITDVNIFFENLHNVENCNQSVSNPMISVATTDYRLNLPEQNAFTYICGYLLKKCHIMHVCEGINNYIESAQNADDNEFVHHNSLNPNSVLFTNPPDTFIALIKLMDERFKLFFRNETLNCIGKEILKNMQDINFDSCCLCFPLDYLKTLFIRISIFNILRHNNRNFRDKAKCKYFSVSNM